MKINLQDFDNLIIFQFGKVGSSTLTASFIHYIETIHTERKNSLYL